MQALGYYLCGCNIEEKQAHSFHLLPTEPGEDPQYTSRRFDDEGFMICPEHGERRYGWRSIPASNNHPGMKHPYMSMSALEIERRMMFGKPIPKTRPLQIKSTAPDLRDYRDPQSDQMAQVVQAALAEIRAGGNGHASRL